MNDRTYRQVEIEFFFKLSRLAADMMSGPAETAATGEAVELRDDIDLMLVTSEGAAIRAQSARLLEKFDAWQVAAR